MATDCCSAGETTLLYACSGCSPVGQATHELAARFSTEGVGAMACLAGVGAHLSGFVLSAKECDRLVVIDGCPQECAAKIFAHLDIHPHVHFVLSREGLTRKLGQRWAEEDVARAREILLERLGTPA